MAGEAEVARALFELALHLGEGRLAREGRRVVGLQLGKAAARGLTVLGERLRVEAEGALRAAHESIEHRSGGRADVHHHIRGERRDVGRELQVPVAAEAREGQQLAGARDVFVGYQVGRVLPEVDAVLGAIGRRRLSIGVDPVEDFVSPRGLDLHDLQQIDERGHGRLVGLAGALIVQAVDVEAPGDVLQGRIQQHARDDLQGTYGLGPGLGQVRRLRCRTPHFSQTVRGQRFGRLRDEQRLIEFECGDTAARRHRILVADRGSDDGPHGHEQNRNEQCDAPLP